MLVCAEDLGAVPACVPQVLQSLDMLSLRIERWTRDYAKPDAPYIDLAQYPRLSVCTPSVHDTSTLRLWWHEPECDRAVYARRLGLDETPPEDLTPELCQRIIERQLTANSILCIFQIQDLFALTADLRTADPQDERINVPGTTDTANWSYRIPVTLAELARHEDLNRLLMALIAARRQRRLT